MQPAKLRNKPLKRPTQARARFTVDAIFDAFVRILRQRGWSGVTTRAVALETGVAVGTLYDYFPSKEALLSGYIRHQVERLMQRLEREVVLATGLDWQTRVRRLVRLSCGQVDEQARPFFDAELLELERAIAEPWHHQRVYQELACKWREAVAACADLPRQPRPESIDALFIAVWGGRRYGLTAQLSGQQVEAWLLEMEELCCARILMELARAADVLTSPPSSNLQG
ncbi:TetR/AcrR family transcriptional regulator [Pseudomonas sp. BN415]|uniref:TetR/AcrR family transcriptional regulator n=1 Tax=Pseudomonas sp. BN415 TaxID=2567889 RepID=UPI0024556626|nr:TetR/AcrR family transcriptional regulator [Pseudomonas sp. BN415]MDH4580860.1 TetR/AcrR family transcriptional regulator [Pseudomonas sp. BN415]